MWAYLSFLLSVLNVKYIWLIKNATNKISTKTQLDFFSKKTDLERLFGSKAASGK